VCTSPENQEKSTTAQRLADEYRVGRDTIEKDGAFAEAVDTLEAEMKQNLRSPGQGGPKTTKRSL